MGVVRIGVFADSHGNLHALRDAVRRAGKLDMAVHLGDYAGDARILTEEGLACGIVRGNNDFGSSSPTELLLDVEGVKIFCTHGPLQSVYWGLDKLYYTAKERGARAALFGHTHRPCLDNNGGLILLNPGSVAEPRGGARESYAILEIRGGKADASIHWVY